MHSICLHSDDDDDEGGDEPTDNADGKKGRRTSGTNMGRPGRRSEAKQKKQRTGFAKFRHNAYKKLFGWMDPQFRRNGKKLEGNSSAVWWVMVSLTSSCSIRLVTWSLYRFNMWSRAAFVFAVVPTLCRAACASIQSPLGRYMHKLMLMAS